jgi:serine/threonine protein kinase
MLAGKFCFYGETDEKFMARMREGVKFPDKEWRSISKAAKSLLRGLLDPNPETRLTAEQALTHRWFAPEDAHIRSSSMSADRPHMTVADARILEDLQLAAKTESLSLQLSGFTPSSHRRRMLLNGGDIAEDDAVLRTEEMEHQAAETEREQSLLAAAAEYPYDVHGRAFEDYYGAGDESDEEGLEVNVLPGRMMAPVHMDPPIATIRARPAEV